MIELGLATIPAVEKRDAASDSYTDLLIKQRVAAATGTADSSALGVIESCAGLWGRAFAAAESDKLGAAMLARIGRALLLKGEAVYLVDRLIEVTTWDITGRVDPATWLYRCDLAGPSTTDTRVRPAASVLHFRIGQTKEQPWKGVSPFERAGLTRDLLANIERSLSCEFGGPIGHVLPVPAGSTQTDLASDVAALKGNVALGETMAGGHGEGRAGAPLKDWQPQRIGPNPPQTAVLIHDSIERTLLAAAGVPADLAGGIAEAGSRESWRRFVASTIAPVGRIVGEERLRRDHVLVPGCG